MSPNNALTRMTTAKLYLVSFRHKHLNLTLYILTYIQSHVPCWRIWIPLLDMSPDSNNQCHCNSCPKSPQDRHICKDKQFINSSTFWSSCILSPFLCNTFYIKTEPLDGIIIIHIQPVHITLVFSSCLSELEHKLASFHSISFAQAAKPQISNLTELALTPEDMGIKFS